MATEPKIAGDIPSDLQGQWEALRDGETPEAKAAAVVYREALDGKFPLDELERRSQDAMLLA